MNQKDGILILLSFGTVLLILGYVARVLHLFQTFWWLDQVFHFVGGVLLGLLALLTVARTTSAFWSRAFRMFIFVICIAFLWEGFQLYGHSPEFIEDNVLPSLADVISGVAGGFFSLILMARFKQKYHDTQD